MTEGQETVLDILRNALEMEAEGKAFFERVAEMMKHPRAKEMFVSLAKQENRHIEVLGGELKRLEDGDDWASLEEMRSVGSGISKVAVFQDRQFKRLKLRPDAGELEALNIGIEVEKKSIDYYRSAGSQVSNPKAKEIFNWLVGEEAGHLTILTAEYENRTKSGFYYDNMEFSLEVM